AVEPEDAERDHVPRALQDGRGSRRQRSGSGEHHHHHGSAEHRHPPKGRAAESVEPSAPRPPEYHPRERGDDERQNTTSRTPLRWRTTITSALSCRRLSASVTASMRTDWNANSPPGVRSSSNAVLHDVQ